MAVSYDEIRRQQGPRLRSARERSDIRQRDAAEMCGKSHAWLAEIERGKSDISLEHTILLLNYYETPLSWVTRGWLPGDTPTPRTLGDWERLFPNNPTRASALYQMNKELSEYEIRYLARNPQPSNGTGASGEDAIPQR